MNKFDSPYTFYTLLNKDNPVISGLIMPSVGDLSLGFVQRTLSNSLFSYIFDAFSDLVSLLDISGNDDSDLMEKILLDNEDIFSHVKDLININSDQKDFINSIYHFHFVLSDFLYCYRHSVVASVDNECYEFLEDSPICFYIQDKLKIHDDKIDKIIFFNDFIKSVLKSLEEVKQ